jgi:hypothetical protein
MDDRFHRANALAIRRLEGKPLSVEQQEKLAEAYNVLFVRAYEAERQLNESFYHI